MNSAVSHRILLNRTSGEGDANQPQETAKRAIELGRNHHCESRRGGTVNRGEAVLR